jgi:hypothetical protein
MAFSIPRERSNACRFAKIFFGGGVEHWWMSKS